MKMLCVLFAALFVSVQAQGQTVTAAADPWPPFVDENHPHDGVALQIIREAFATQGYTLEMNFMPWARAEEGVKRGTYDILPGTWFTEARAKELLYSEPYITNEIKFIQRRGEGFVYDGLESVAGKTIGTIRDYGYGDEFSNAEHFTQDPVPDFIINVRKLINERVDLAIEDELVARARIASADPGLIDEIEFVEPPFSVAKLHITSSFANPRHEEIVNAFNAGLVAIRENGTYRQIMEENNLR